MTEPDIPIDTLSAEEVYEVTQVANDAGLCAPCLCNGQSSLATHSVARSCSCDTQVGLMCEGCFSVLRDFIESDDPVLNGICGICQSPVKLLSAT